jgi:methylase of polypeptide subunit release factors
MVHRKTVKTLAFGDFQTPLCLARQAISVLKELSFTPKSVIEPTCGKGSFLLATMDAFPKATKFIGVDINREYLAVCRDLASQYATELSLDLIYADFFTFDWSSSLSKLDNPILIVGNPPWVTSAELGSLKSSNLPNKSNFQGFNGLDALTGKSNFDISEWMLLKYLNWLDNRIGYIAVLCKTAVARKVLKHIWNQRYPVQSARIYNIDANKHFRVAVESCFFVLEVGDLAINRVCLIYSTIDSKTESSVIGYENKIIFSNISSYRNYLLGGDKHYTWRSGIKHDCSKIMELNKEGNLYINGNGNAYELEETYIYPLLKSSDIGNNRISRCRKYLLVTQQSIGEDTAKIGLIAPKTWKYLTENLDFFARRGSSIYKNRPEFSIFGVGRYSFSDWKVAISGFYKTLEFRAVGLIDNKSVVFDDTIYFLSCQSQKEAEFISFLLNSQTAQEFLLSMIFWDEKRPITIDLLKRLNIHALACDLNREEEYIFHVEQRHIQQLPGAANG